VVETAILCERLVRRFGSFTAVDRLSFEVRAGEVFGLLGANGSGKSTTIRMLTGILPPTEGKVVVAGIDVVADPLAVRSSIGYVAQKVSLYPNLRVHENIAFYGGIYGLSPARIRERAEELGPRLGLSPADRRVLARDLPAGVRQRLAILLALLHRPRVIFLDEPTAGVDLANRRDLFDLMHELAEEGMALLVTSHHLDEMERCRRLALIDRGRLLGIGSTDELKESLGGGRRYAVVPPPGGPAGEALVATLLACGLRAERPDPSHAGAAFVWAAGDREEDRLRATVAAQGGIWQVFLSPPPLESVFSKVVRERRRLSSGELPAVAGGPPKEVGR
jgi:ABC-type multidrug transport system ATPase subunit